MYRRIIIVCMGLWFFGNGLGQEYLDSAKENMVHTIEVAVEEAFIQGLYEAIALVEQLKPEEVVRRMNIAEPTEREVLRAEFYQAEALLALSKLLSQHTGQLSDKMVSRLAEVKDRPTTQSPNQTMEEFLVLPELEETKSPPAKKKLSKEEFLATVGASDQTEPEPSKSTNEKNFLEKFAETLEGFTKGIEEALVGQPCEPPTGLDYITAAGPEPTDEPALVRLGWASATAKIKMYEQCLAERERKARDQESRARVELLKTQTNALKEGYGGVTVYRYSSLDKEHWISRNIDSGRQIKLEDESLWEIAPIDRVDTATWLATERITVVKGHNPDYPYTLINTDTEEAVDAQLLSQ